LSSACRSCASSAATSGSAGATSIASVMPACDSSARANSSTPRHERAQVLALELRARQPREAQVRLRDLSEAVDLADDRLHEPPRLGVLGWRVSDLVAQQLGVEADRRQRVAHLVA
jgi:hypothetical protein